MRLLEFQKKTYHQCHLISAWTSSNEHLTDLRKILSGNKPTWKSIGWPIQSAISPPNNTVKTERFVRFSNQKQRKNNISFPPKKKMRLESMPRSKVNQSSETSFNEAKLDPSPSVRPTDKPPNTKKKTWAVPTGAGAGFTSPSFCGMKSLCGFSPVTVPDFRSKIIHADWKKISLKKGFNLAMWWHSGIFDSDTVNKIWVSTGYRSSLIFFVQPEPWICGNPAVSTRSLSLRNVSTNIQ